MGSFPHPRNGIVKIDYEFVLLFKKHGKAPTVSAETKEASKLTTEEWNRFFNGHWNFPGEKQSGHLAMFPEELPSRLIRMFSFVGETVLDPFLGSGTSSLAAMKQGRNSTGYEVNRDFEAVIREKLSKAVNEHGATVTFDIGGGNEHAPDKATLPYIFRDPLALDKKTDPREATYGSRIQMGERGTSKQV